MLIALPLHVLSAVIWVGGMFFAHNMLRPSLASLDPPQRLVLMRDTLTRFFRWVWIAIALLWFSGVWIITTGFGWGAIPWHVLIMMIVAVLMTVIFGLIYFDHFPKVKAFIDADDFKAAGAQLARLSKLVFANLIMGLFVVAIAATRGIMAF